MNEQSDQIIPEEIKGWNWGAFMCNIAWGFGNRTYLPLLCLIPVFNIIWIFICGIKGNEWAWQKAEIKNPEIFLTIQKTWNRAGLALFILSIAFFILYFIILAVIGISLGSVL